MDFVNKVVKILSKPKEFWADAEKEKGIGEAVRYLALLTIVSAIISYLVSMLVLKNTSGQMDIMVVVAAKFGVLGFFNQSVELLWLVMTVVLYALSFVFVFVTAAIMNLFLRLVKGTGGYDATYKSTVYSSTPQMLLSTIPIVGSLAGFYTLYLMIIGLSRLHNITFKRVVLAYIYMILAVTAIGLATAFIIISVGAGYR